MKFDANCALLRVFLGRYLYEDPRLLIRLYINEKGQELLSWNDLVQKLCRAEAKAKI